MIKIAHVSDIHIRNLRYHDEYQAVFNELYKKLDELQPDIIINTGDTVHSKVQISPELVDITSRHFWQMAKIAPYHIILGNHDLNLMNKDRTDAISPIINALNCKNIFLYKNSGRYDIDNGVTLWVFGIADELGYPNRQDWEANSDRINIGLFHGSVSTCVTDSEWMLKSVEHDLSQFSGLDYVLMGDIHKRQSFMGGRAAYAGSLIQQNYGESVDKGFLFWEINDKDTWNTTFYELKNGRKFFTIEINDSLIIPDVKIDDDSRIRLKPTRPLTLIEQKDLEKEIRKRFKPHDVITLSPKAEQQNNVDVKIPTKKFDIRSIKEQEKLIRAFLRDTNDEIVDRVVALNEKFSVADDNDVLRGTTWNINKICWNNLFNYSENNVIDFSKLGGLTGIFAPNATGKSNLVDVISQACFDETTKGLSKNIFIINDNKQVGSVIAEISSNERNYIVERSIERIKYGQRSENTKEWGKTVVDFYDVTNGEKLSLNGMLRPETERNIRKKLGTFEDFMLTSLSAQWNQLDIIACKETKRKEILYKFLDLDIFEKKLNAAKEESRKINDIVNSLEKEKLDVRLSDHARIYLSIEEDINEVNKLIEEELEKVNSYKQIISDCQSQKHKISVNRQSDDIRVDINNSLSNIQNLRDKHTKLINLKASLSNDLDQLNKQCPDCNVDDTKKEIKETHKLLAELNAALVKINADITSKKKHLKLLDSVPCGDQFPQCHFIAEAMKFNVSSDKLNDDKISTQLQIEFLQKKLDGLDDMHTEIVNRKHSISKTEMELQKLELEITNACLKIEAENKTVNLLESELKAAIESDESYKHNKKLDNIVKQNQSLINGSDSVLKKYRDILNEWHQKLGSEKQKIEVIQKQLNELHEARNSYAAYQCFMNCMGKDGIPSIVLKLRLPKINDEINKILSICAEFSINIENDQDEQSLRIYLQYGNYKRRLIELGSGAEKMISSIAIRSALLSISTLPKTNLFIIDEGFGKLDPRNMENINHLFDYLRSSYDHILVISHLDIMKDMVDNNIDIAVDSEGYAHVEVC